jgi:N-acetylmuramoyl-L-alanine amidase
MIRLLFVLLLPFTALFAGNIPPYKNVAKKPLPQTLYHAVKPLVILDAGHGGYDEGSKVHSLLEKRMTLTTTLLTRKYLDEMGYRVLLTRSRDIYLSLPQRVAIANRNKAALFVSIHYNAARNEEAKGIEVFYYDKGVKGAAAERVRASHRLANTILYHLLDETAAKSRGVKRGNHHVTRETEMPAALVEAGFITNDEERELLKSKEYQDRIAKGIAQGIDKYLKSVPGAS